MTRPEAARIAAVLPQPKKRGAAPQGFTRRHGNSIAARIGVVSREGLDACVYQGIAPPKDKAPPPSRAPKACCPARSMRRAQAAAAARGCGRVSCRPASDAPLVEEPAPATNIAAPVPEAVSSEPPPAEQAPPQQ